MFGNPRGEVIKCRNCSRFHDIKRGTFVICACGAINKSKEYNSELMKKYLVEVNNYDNL